MNAQLRAVRDLPACRPWIAARLTHPTRRTAPALGRGSGRLRRGARRTTGETRGKRRATPPSHHRTVGLFCHKMPRAGQNVPARIPPNSETRAGAMRNARQRRYRQSGGAWWQSLQAARPVRPLNPSPRGRPVPPPHGVRPPTRLPVRPPAPPLPLDGGPKRLLDVVLGSALLLLTAPALLAAALALAVRHGPGAVVDRSTRAASAGAPSSCGRCAPGGSGSTCSPGWCTSSGGAVTGRPGPARAGRPPAPGRRAAPLAAGAAPRADRARAGARPLRDALGRDGAARSALRPGPGADPDPIPANRARPGNSGRIRAHSCARDPPRNGPAGQGQPERHRSPAARLQPTGISG